jgi:transposase|nr:hypothetical protein [Neorhizobium tomejilense]
MENEKTINLVWRDENYGGISGTVAFRSTIEPYPSDTATKRIQRAYKEAGFEIDHRRMSWIARKNPDEAPAALVVALQNLGYEVSHSGCTPDEFTEAPTVATAQGPRP